MHLLAIWLGESIRLTIICDLLSCSYGCLLKNLMGKVVAYEMLLTLPYAPLSPHLPEIFENTPLRGFGTL